MFKKANSLIFFCRLTALNLIDEKVSFEGKKLILVPDFFVFLINFIGCFVFPFSNDIAYSFWSLKIVKSSFSDKAFTTETPTPCKPPETL